MTSFAKACIDFSNNLKNLRFSKLNTSVTPSSTPSVTDSPTSAAVLAFEPEDTVKCPLSISHDSQSEELIISAKLHSGYQHYQHVNSSGEEKHRCKKTQKNSEPVVKGKSTHNDVVNDKSTSIYNKISLITNNMMTSGNKNCLQNKLSEDTTTTGTNRDKDECALSNKPTQGKHMQKNIPQDSVTTYYHCTKPSVQNKNSLSNGSLNNDPLKAMILNTSDNLSLNTRMSNSSPNSPIPRHHFKMRNKLSSDTNDDNSVISNKTPSSNITNSLESPFTFKATLSPTMTHRLAILARNCQNTVTNHNHNNNNGGGGGGVNDSTYCFYNRYSHNSTSSPSSSSPIPPLHRGTTVAAIKQRLINQGLRINLNIPVKKSTSTRFRDYIRRQKRGCPHTVELLWLNKNFMNNRIFHYLSAEEVVVQKCLEQLIAVRLLSALNRRLQCIKIVQLAERLSSTLCNILEVLFNSSSPIVPLYLSQSNTTTFAGTTLMKTSSAGDGETVTGEDNVNCSPWTRVTDDENNSSVCKQADCVLRHQQNGFVQGNNLPISNYANQNDTIFVNNSNNNNNNSLTTSCLFKKMTDSKLSINSHQSNSENCSCSCCCCRNPEESCLSTHRFTHLTLKSCSILDQSLSRLVSLFPALKTLEFECCNDFTELAFWSCLTPNIEHLTVFDCINVSDESLNAIGQLLPELKCFRLQAYHITDAALTYFSTKQRVSMQTMELIQCMDITNQGVMTLAYTLDNLQVLNLSGCSKLTDDGLDVICENLKRLTSLNLSWCAKITDSGIECVACDLILLKKLILDRCTELTDLGVSHLATMPNLQHLSVRWCINISDGSIPHLLSTTGLKYLCLTGCKRISEDGLCTLARHPRLNYLELAHLPAATHPVRAYLNKHLPGCRLLC
ncbi:unnamed protein product [Trichobilharzia szidati]|nr:unnamed protein product [Trichobilharzia szidati]